MAKQRKKIQTFKPDTAQTLAKMAHERKLRPQAGVRTYPTDLPLGRGTFLVKANETLPGRSGNTPGTATGTLWHFNTDDELEESETEVTLYNIVAASVPADTFLAAYTVEGRIVVIVEDCGSS
ncbi:MAG: hypothetical protein AB7U73_15305 [Pirellulales bacterium]